MEGRPLDAFVLAHEATIRVLLFAAVFAAMAVWEWRAPCRQATVPRAIRWANNLGLTALNTVLLRLLFPAAAVGVAALAAERDWGLLNHLQVPAWAAIPVAIVVMDFVIWLQHVMVHAIPVLWRLHRVHHADPDYDLTTGARFHPLEMILSMSIKLTTVVLLGPPLVAVILFELLLSGMALFNHANVRLPARLDRALRWLIVTPDMHRVHHSVADDEANSNFGFNLSCWDRLLGTYRDQPRRGHLGMVIGIRGCRGVREVSWLPGMLVLPFRGRRPADTINCRFGRQGQRHCE